jgi:bacterial/archaeal transporter family protein
MTIESWQLWALLSAVFAALTAIFAKIGVENIGSDLATFIRTIVVLISFLLLLLATGQFTTSEPISPRTWTFLILSGLGTGGFLALLLSRAQARPRFDGRADR